MNKTIFYKSVNVESLTNGPGNRIVIFLQGCSIHCKGCQNTALWPFGQGIESDVTELAQLMADIIQARNLDGITISGGEPTDQSNLLYFLMELKKLGVHVVLYSGYTLEEIYSDPSKNSVLFWADILVDGPFIQSQDSAFVVWRGSHNQRPIDLNVWASNLLNGESENIFLDWDNIVQITGGNIVLPVGLADELGFEDAKPTKMCGERG